MAAECASVRALRCGELRRTERGGRKSVRCSSAHDDARRSTGGIPMHTLRYTACALLCTARIQGDEISWRNRRSNSAGFTWFQRDHVSQPCTTLVFEWPFLLCELRSSVRCRPRVRRGEGMFSSSRCSSLLSARSDGGGRPSPRYAAVRISAFCGRCSPPLLASRRAARPLHRCWGWLRRSVPHQLPLLSA